MFVGTGVAQPWVNFTQLCERLQAYGGCPRWESTTFSDEMSPFGWPLTPNDWSPGAQKICFGAKVGFCAEGEVTFERNFFGVGGGDVVLVASKPRG